MQPQPFVYIFGSIITLLIVSIVALICIIILRDRRDLKTKQIADDLEKMDELVKDLVKIKGELMPALTALKKQTDTAFTQIEGQLRQLNASGLEHRQQSAMLTAEKQDDRKDRGPRQPGKGKGWGGNRPERGERGDRSEKRMDFPAAPRASDEAVTINDGEKYARVAELAANGLTAQEIAKKLNVEQTEVALVLELKGKKPV